MLNDLCLTPENVAMLRRIVQRTDEALENIEKYQAQPDSPLKRNGLHNAEIQVHNLVVELLAEAPGLVSDGLWRKHAAASAALSIVQVSDRRWVVAHSAAWSHVRMDGDYEVPFRSGRVVFGPAKWDDCKAYLAEHGNAVKR